MKRKNYAILIIMAIIFSASSLCVLSRSQDSVPEPDPTLVYEFSIEYSDQNSKYNTLTDLKIIARENGSNFFDEGISSWHLPVNVTDKNIRDLLKIYLPEPFTNYLGSHLKNESVEIPYMQRTISNSSEGFNPGKLNLFIIKNNPNDKLEINKEINLFDSSNPSKAMITSQIVVGYASWNDNPVALEFSHSHLDAFVLTIKEKRGNINIEINAIYDIYNGIMLKGDVVITNEETGLNFVNELRLKDTIFVLNTQGNLMIYLWVALVSLIPMLITVSVMFKKRHSGM